MNIHYFVPTDEVEDLTGKFQFMSCLHSKTSILRYTVSMVLTLKLHDLWGIFGVNDKDFLGNQKIAMALTS